LRHKFDGYAEAAVAIRRLAERIVSACVAWCGRREGATHGAHLDAVMPPDRVSLSTPGSDGTGCELFHSSFVAALDVDNFLDASNGSADDFESVFGGATI